MLDIFSKLPLIGQNDDTDDLTEEELEAEARRDRIEFHRTRVRNGPVKFTHVTNGMIRRAQARDLQRQMRKTRRRQVRDYFKREALMAVLRGQLQLAGVLPYVYERDLDAVAQVKAVVWIVQRFGAQGDGAVSFAEADVRAALEKALKVYGDHVGLPGLTIPEGYILPIAEVA